MVPRVTVSTVPPRIATTRGVGACAAVATTKAATETQRHRADNHRHGGAKPRRRKPCPFACSLLFIMFVIPVERIGDQQQKNRSASGSLSPIERCPHLPTNTY